MLWSDRPGTKTSAAVRADILQDGFDAVAAEGALKGANHCLNGIGRKRRVTILARRPKFKHGVCF